MDMEKLYREAARITEDMRKQQIALEAVNAVADVLRALDFWDIIDVVTTVEEGGDPRLKDWWEKAESIFDATTAEGFPTFSAKTKFAFGSIMEPILSAVLGVMGGNPLPPSEE